MLQAVAIAAVATITLPAGITSLTAINRSPMVAAGLSDGQVVIWNGRDAAPAFTFRAHTARVLAVGSNEDGTQVWSLAEDGSLAATPVSAGAKSRSKRLALGAQHVRAAAFSADGSMLATGGELGEIRLFSTASGTLTRTLRGHRTELQSIAVRPGSMMVASASAEADLRLWDGASGRELASPDGELSVFTVAFSPRDGLLASGGADRKVTLRDPKTFKSQGVLALDKPSLVGIIAWSPDARQMAVADVDDETLSKGTVHIVDAAKLAIVSRLDTGGVPPQVVVYSSDGGVIVAAAGRDLRAWAAPTGTRVP
jgi:WD40 repeat protein